jgi:hypothetical protein
MQQCTQARRQMMLPSGSGARAGDRPQALRLHANPTVPKSTWRMNTAPSGLYTRRGPGAAKPRTPSRFLCN